jgi:hypothetical protein
MLNNYVEELRSNGGTGSTSPCVVLKQFKNGSLRRTVIFLAQKTQLLSQLASCSSPTEMAQIVNKLTSLHGIDKSGL